MPTAPTTASSTKVSTTVNDVNHAFLRYRDARRRHEQVIVLAHGLHAASKRSTRQARVQAPASLLAVQRFSQLTPARPTR
jgi:hypothetical protein